jgi:hypothetical protein
MSSYCSIWRARFSQLCDSATKIAARWIETLGAVAKRRHSAAYCLHSSAVIIPHHRLRPVRNSGFSRDKLGRLRIQTRTPELRSWSTGRRQDASPASTRCSRRAHGFRSARQHAFRDRQISSTVRQRIRRSSKKLQLVTYQRSSSTRRFIRWSVGVSPRNPLTCAHPVIPGLTW